jgi:uncharacterized protein (DUF58 family)
MWKNFISSIGLLAIAMAAALYSSGAARSGRVFGAGVAALTALAIAIWVGVKFVPRLASGVDWDWLPFFSRYRVTREGWMYFCAVTVVVVAAFNTANNLLYMVLSALLAVLVLSGFLSALNFKFIRTAVRIPSHCYAGEPFPITINIHNDKRTFPSFSIFFKAADESAFRFAPFYVPVIRGMQHVSQMSQAMLSRRGRYTLQDLRGVSRYPFGFFTNERSYRVEAECICYPEIRPQEQLDLTSVDLRGSHPRFQRGAGQDLYMIRDYLPSDSARHVHWKASAKTSVLKTREYAAEDSRRVTLALDRWGRSEDVDDFEALVSQAASLAYHLIHAGVEVRLVTDEWDGSTLEGILEYLALVELSASAEFPFVDEGAMRLSLRS